MIKSVSPKKPQKTKTLGWSKLRSLADEKINGIHMINSQFKNRKQCGEREKNSVFQITSIFYGKSRHCVVMG